MANILLVGCGAIGYRLGLALSEQGHRVTAVKRHALHQPAPFTVITADICQPGALRDLPVDFDVLVFMVSAGSRELAAYQALYQVGLAQVLQHFAAADKSPKCFLVSSSSVYGQDQGEWVDEDSPTMPLAATSQCLVVAEQQLWAADAGHCVVRFSGIYGPGRDWLIRRAASGEPIQQTPPNYTNRIHQDDCVGVLVFLIQHYLAGGRLDACYLASDHDPAPLWEVMQWIAQQYHYQPPSPLPATASASQNKRCRNARLTALGYAFLFPGYRDGYLKPG